MLAVGLLLTAGIALHVEESRGISAEETLALLTITKNALIEAEGGPVVVSTDLPGACQVTERCTVMLKTESGERHVLYLRLLGIPTRIRVIGERDAGDKSQIDLPRDRSKWPSRIQTFARELFPVPPAPSASPIASPAAVGPAAPVAEPSIKPFVGWTLVGSGVAFGLVGGVFGVQNHLVRQSAAETADANTYADLDRQAHLTGVGANVLYGAAIAAVAAGVVLLLTE